MLLTFKHQNIELKADLNQPIDLSLPISTNSKNASAWYCPPVVIEPVRANGFVGSIAEGGAVNFNNIHLNPHGNCTHTECVGHIMEDPYTIADCLNNFFFSAHVLSVAPILMENGDHVIQADQLDLSTINHQKALIIRTLPNELDKQQRQYSNANPPYLSTDAVQKIVNADIEHLLLDLPSVDRELDEGKLAGHHIFWQYPKATRKHCTISELVYIPNEIEDGDYLLNLQVLAIENDASPSRPLLFRWI